MKKIRKGVFETNSSSTHSICIAKDTELNIPQKLYFSFGEFGWKWETLQSTEDKASYLYTGLYSNGHYEEFLEIVKTLEDEGIEVSWQTPQGDNFWENGYVDHSDELREFLNDVCNDKNKLLNFLFSNLSFILTGNDNEDGDVDISVDYPYEEYYKGN